MNRMESGLQGDLRGANIVLAAVMRPGRRPDRPGPIRTPTADEGTIG